jgi:ribosomal protein L21E
MRVFIMDAIDNFDSVYAIMQKVKIINGFYKGNYGTITNYDIKKNAYHVDIMINNTHKLIACKEHEIRIQKTWKFWE